MKKLCCIFLIVWILCSFAACGSEKEKEKEMTASNTIVRPEPSSSVPQNQSPETDNPEPSSPVPQTQPPGAEPNTETAPKPQPTAPGPTQNANRIDIDLTKLSSTMVYSEVYNMMVFPDDYIGKTVKMNGAFEYYEDPETKKLYFACIIADAAACCTQGLEFILAGNPIYPDDYPEIYSDITVTGTFEVYEENGFQYCRLVDAAL